MELYNAIKSDLVSIWNVIGIPVIVFYIIVGVIALSIIVFAFASIIGTRRRMNRRMSRMDRW